MRSRVSLFLAVLVTAAFPVLLTADEVGKMYGNAAGVEWSLSIAGHEAIVMTVAAPDGTRYQKTFNGGQNPRFTMGDLKKSGAIDGTYHYELRVVPRVSGAIRAALAAARASGDDAAIMTIMRANGLDRQIVQSGAFTVLSGAFVDPNAVEADANDSTANAAGGRALTSEARRPGPISADDQVIPDDLIVQSSLCVGFDCVSGESFGFDTVRLKENNLQINFSDTSVAPFPTNDWTIVANDSSSGGGSYLAFNDVTAGRKTFVVEAAAPANALYVDSTGNVGLSQSNPVLDLHITTTDTPAMRLEQTAGGGWTAQTWDIAGNEANFFVRDVTGGSLLPFRIRPGAPTSSIDIQASGNVGIGTSSPAQKLEVSGGINTTGSGGYWQGNWKSMDYTGNTVRIGGINGGQWDSVEFYTNGTARARITSDGRFQFANGVQVLSGAGTPEGVVTSPVGSLYLRTDGGATTTLYVKTSGAGSTGWTAK